MTPEQRAELRALADRVEAIQIEPGNVEQETEGRRLGAEILKALGYREGNRFLYDPAGRLLFRVPDMLHSVDDALKAVPTGLRWSLSTTGDGRAVAAISNPRTGHSVGPYQVVASTASRALTAAALRAMSVDVVAQEAEHRAKMDAARRARADEGEGQ